MPQFTLTAIDQSGTIQTKRINAGTKQQAESLCVELGMQVISVKLPLSQRFTSSTRSSFKLIPFAEELLALQKAGLSITESLSGLHSKANESQKPVLSGLIQSIQQGQSFSEALANYPNEFPTLLRALVQAAEKTSNLPQAIEKYLEYAQQADLIKRKISNAALYPSLLLLVGGGVLMFLLMYVIPRFAGVYEGLQGDLPWLSEVLLWWGRAMRDHAVWVFTVLAVLAYAIYSTIKNTHYQHKVLQLVLRNSTAAKLWQGYTLSRLYRALGLLLSGGIPVQTSLAQVEQLLGQDEAHQLRKVSQRIAQGEPLSTALSESQLTTEISFQMLTVGERTGSVGEMLTKTAQFLEADTSKAVEAFSRIFEPVLMALIGLIIGVVVVLMYMPIFELANSLQ
ncbi:MAG: type II secretion system F family protein [Limnobacter sp.]|uniref:type II secretion system F family protein n=1 Tax=Limnobacter sp. TaxID=2003368 RepID=UPI004038230D